MESIHQYIICQLFLIAHLPKFSPSKILSCIVILDFNTNRHYWITSAIDIQLSLNMVVLNNRDWTKKMVSKINVPSKPTLNSLRGRHTHTYRHCRQSQFQETSCIKGQHTIGLKNCKSKEQEIFWHEIFLKV